MVVGIKDAAKLLGISIISCCAVLVCTMFLNYYMDIVSIKEQITMPQVMVFYEAQVSTAKVVCMVSGGCLLMTSVIMLIFTSNTISIRIKRTGNIKSSRLFPFADCQKLLCVRKQYFHRHDNRFLRCISYHADILQRTE